MGVLAVGMHRSGTSAVAAALETAGLTTGPRAEQLEPSPDNPDGFFELRAVNDLNDEVLRHLGGSWDGPPHRPEGWADDPRITAYVDRARNIVASAMGADRFLVKDPRITLLLPLWRRALLDRCCAVMIIRDPAEVAWSLALRDGLPTMTGLALWSAYNRSALAGLSGLPTFVCRFEDLVEHPMDVLTELSQSLRRWGQLGDEVDVSEWVGRIKPELRRSTWPRNQSELLDIPGEVDALHKSLCEHLGPHDSFQPETASEPGWWEAPLLEERRMAGVRVQEFVEAVGSLQVESAHFRHEMETAHAELNASRAELASTGAALGATSAERDALRFERDANRDERDTARMERDEALGRLEATASALAGTEVALHDARSRWEQLEGRLPVRIYRAISRLAQPRTQ